jgi:hypothetical protein
MSWALESLRFHFLAVSENRIAGDPISGKNISRIFGG